MEVKEKTEALMMQERVFEETTAKILQDAAKERLKMLTEHNQIIEWSKEVLNKVQTTYQTQAMNYEVQAIVIAKLSKQLKQEKQATEERVKMGINRIRIIVRGRQERMQ